MMNKRRLAQWFGTMLLLVLVVVPAIAQPAAPAPEAAFGRWVIATVDSTGNVGPAAPAPEAAFGRWVIATVDSTGNVGLWTCQDLDSAGYPHIGYYDALNGDLKYAYEDAGGWHIETVDSTGDTGQFCSLKVDANDYSHISYYYSTGSDLKYAYQDASGWHVETADPTNLTGRYTSLDLDANGYPHISYESLTGYTLKYAYKDAGGWHYESPPATGAVYNTALVLDGDGWPRVAYNDNTGYDIYYGYKDGTGWHFEVAANLDVTLRGPALALDATGAPYIAYSLAGTSAAVYYCYKSGISWTQELVDGAGGTSNLSLVIDSTGRAHLGYDYAGGLKYGERSVSGWRVAQVELPPSMGNYNSIAADAQGRPHIAYWDATNNDLKYAQLQASSYTENIVFGVGNYVSLQYDSSNRPRVCFYDAVNQDLVYGWRDATGWHTEPVDTSWDVGQYCSLALDEQDYPHISYYYATEGDLRYAYKDGTGWHVENVDAAPSPVAGKWTSLVLDAAGWPHISYYHETWVQLRHAYKDGAGWHTEGVDTSQAGRYTSIAMDPTGVYPRIAYQKISTTDLYYAYKGASGWTTEMAYAGVDEEPVGLYNSLRIDAAGYPHIAFARDVARSGDLLYSYKDSGGWHAALVDNPSAGKAGLWNSLVLDASGRQHIVTLDQTAGELRYAWKTGSSWYTMPLAEAGAEGGYCSLEVDGADHLGVAYYNAGGPQEVNYLHNNCLSVAVAPNPPACVNTTVAFDNLSFGVLPVAWEWTFGDGMTSTAAYPTHTYAMAGVYPVTLTAANSCGAGEFTLTQVISSTPTAGYTFAVPVCAGNPVQFLNTTVASATVFYTWTFGDGGVSNAISPTHTYAAPRNYDCYLVATNGCGEDMEHQVVTAHAGPTVIMPTWMPQSPEVHVPVLFTAAATSTLPVVYAWNFGDGGTGSGITATHAYDTAGNYTVTLTGTTACGTDVVQAVITVVCYEAAVDNLAWTPETPTIDVPATFSATVSGTLPLTCTWDFGDGNVVGPATCAGVVPITHTYAATGTYVVGLTAENDCGTDTVSDTLTVVALPHAAFISNSPVCQGQTMVFTNTSAGAEPLSFLWAFGDGYTSTLRNPTHYYAEGGAFSVTLAASNPYGTSMVTDTVQVVDGVSTADFTWEPAYPAPGQAVTLTATANGTPPVTYEWNLGDGITATGRVVVHTYATTDTYTVTLQAYNNCGGQTAAHALDVAFCTSPAGLTAAFTPTVPAPGTAAFFTATLAAGSEPLTIAWDFGDGAPWGYGATVTHTYASPGVYTASVATWNACGYAGPENLRVEVKFPSHPGFVYLPLVYKGYCADAFEPDNTAEESRPLTLGAPQSHNFSPEGDEDWTHLTLAAGQTYRFWTSNLSGSADTRLYLYQEGQYGSPVAQNDDWASGNCGGTPPDPKQSCFTYTPAAAGVYELKTNQYTGGAQWGCQVQYTLQATQQ